jgi:hypothetical protein
VLREEPPGPPEAAKEKEGCLLPSIFNL